MIKSLKDIQRLTVRTLDGFPITPLDFYFDDQEWTIRYMLAEIQNGLPSRRILLSTHCIDLSHAHDENILIRHSKDQIEKSPHINTTLPLSREKEIEVSQYFRWPFYWNPEINSRENHSSHALAKSAKHKKKFRGHLRSYKGILTHTIEALDGSGGHTRELLIDDKTWKIHYVAVDTQPWWPTGHILIDIDWVDWIHWDVRQMKINLTHAQMEKGPNYNESTTIDRTYESNLYGTYGRRPYWDK